MLQYAFAPNARSYGCLVIDASRASCSERGEGGVGERSPVALPILIALTQSAATRRLCGAAAIIAYFAALIFNLKLLSDIGAAETLLIDKLQCNLRLMQIYNESKRKRDLEKERGGGRGSQIN